MAKVTLLAYTPDPEKNVASAAKLCYAQSDIDTVRDGLTEEKTADFVNMLAEIGHESPIEHANFTFGIEGVSRAFLAQITRHRLASYSVQSQRYVKEHNMEYVTPPEIEENEEALKIYNEAMQSAADTYLKLSQILEEKHYQTFLNKGLDEKSAKRSAEKQAIEDARFVLPNACDTKMIVTMNARSLQNFFTHRCCNRAQWEIREVAKQMLALCLEVAPNIFKKAGPPCFRGACPEGKMSCGLMKEVREEYQNLRK